MPNSQNPEFSSLKLKIKQLYTKKWVLESQKNYKEIFIVNQEIETLQEILKIREINNSSSLEEKTLLNDEKKSDSNSKRNIANINDFQDQEEKPESLEIKVDTPIHFVWFGEIPSNVRDNIIKAASLSGSRKVNLWVSKDNQKREISINEKNQHQYFKDNKIFVNSIEDNLPVEDVTIIHSIFAENHLSITDRMKSASDFTRISVLNKIGGIYLDGDVTLNDTIPNLFSKHQVLLHIEKKESNEHLMVNTDFYDVIAVPENSEIIKCIIDELRVDFNPENKPCYDAGELVKIGDVFHYIINKCDSELKNKLFDAQDLATGLSDLDNDYENVYCFFENLAFPEYLLSCVSMSTLHGSLSWNSISSQELNYHQLSDIRNLKKAASILLKASKAVNSNDFTSAIKILDFRISDNIIASTLNYVLADFFKCKQRHLFPKKATGFEQDIVQLNINYLNLLTETAKKSEGKKISTDIVTKLLRSPAHNKISLFVSEDEFHYAYYRMILFGKFQEPRLISAFGNLLSVLNDRFHTENINNKSLKKIIKNYEEKIQKLPTEVQSSYDNSSVLPKIQEYFFKLQKTTENILKEPKQSDNTKVKDPTGMNDYLNDYQKLQVIGSIPSEYLQEASSSTVSQPSTNIKQQELNPWATANPATSKTDYPSFTEDVKKATHEKIQKNANLNPSAEKPQQQQEEKNTEKWMKRKDKGYGMS